MHYEIDFLILYIIYLTLIYFRYIVSLVWPMIIECKFHSRIVEGHNVLFIDKNINNSHTCNWPDLLMEYAGCNPSAALGDFRCPSSEELSPLAQRFFPFPRFPVAKDPKLYIICVDGVPRLNTCTQGSLFSEATLSCEDQ